ncbi:mechanosensitive ion channel family protein [Pendulispora albinea]|uniref:Mechanosensitive ion channel family protein n=1 Tax=Pendulispora albinea TaxID=2741071 RepID=A0ABZ2M234_9BACT
MGLPALDLILHNLVALGVTVVALMLAAQLLLTVLLRISNRVLRSSLLGGEAGAHADAFRRRVKRTTLIVVAVMSALLLMGAAALSFIGLRALGLLKAWFGHLRHEDFAAAGVRLAYAGGILVAAFIANALVRSCVDTLEKVTERSARLEASRALVTEALLRLRTALRTAVTAGAAMLVSLTLSLPAGVHRVVVSAAYVLVALSTCRCAVVVAHLVVDVLFETSNRFSKLESPLKYLGSLTHLSGVTKRAIDYFAYVGAATWVADRLTPDTWISHAGRVGIRIVALFYAARVLVEICLLFIHEIFMNKTAGHTSAEIRQRKTLVPVAVGVLRYGIYFSTIVMVLREFAIDPTPLLAGAGVLGVAVGFGAQSFVGDIVAGFFILFENLLLVGDEVEVSGVRGTVEEIGVRIIKIRDDAGVLHAIPNGQVRKVANHSKVYVKSVVDVYVPYDEDLARIRAMLESVAEETLYAKVGERVRVEVRVQELGQGCVLLRVMGRVPPGKDDDISIALRARILDALRGANIMTAPRPMQVALPESAALRIAPPAAPSQVEQAEMTESGETMPTSIFKPPAA